MKKTYLSPKMVKVRLRVSHHLLDGSPLPLSGSPASVGSDGNYVTLSRHSSDLWEDDEE